MHVFTLYDPVYNVALRYRSRDIVVVRWPQSLPAAQLSARGVHLTDRQSNPSAVHLPAGCLGDVTSRIFYTSTRAMSARRREKC